MYQEWLDAVPLLISGNASWIKEHNKGQLMRYINYCESHNQYKEAEETRKQMRKYY